MVFFETVSDVEQWARQHGGVDAVNDALSTGAFGNNPHTIRTAIRYVEREELRIARRERDERRAHAISEAEQAAQAAQRSARQASISRWIALACAVIAVAAAGYLTVAG